MSYEKFTRYEQFVDENYKRIVDDFQSKLNITINSRSEFDTYHKWKARERQVVIGEKALKVQASKPTPTPLFYYGKPVLDENGQTKFHTSKRRYWLFHQEQTKPLKEEATR